MFASYIAPASGISGRTHSRRGTGNLVKSVADLLTVAVDPCVFHIFGAVLVVGKIKQNCDVIRVLLISPLEKRLMKWTNYDFYVRLPT